jgi:putative membrane protein
LYLFYLTGWVGGQFGVGFTIAGFWSAFFGALIVIIVSVFFNIVLRDELKGGLHRKQVKRV